MFYLLKGSFPHLLIILFFIVMQIVLKDIHFAYPVSSDVPVLSGLSCTIGEGELVGVIGKTGSGKSTFLQLCTGFLFPDSGEIRVDGAAMRKAKDWSAVRRKLGIVFQFPEKQLFEESVFADVAFGVSRGIEDKEEIKKIVYAALEEVGLSPEEFAGRSPHHLSSGEQRRAALAGVVVHGPELLFLDEPTIGLDRKGASEVESIIRRFHRSGKSVCVVSHDLDFIVRVAERIVVIADRSVKFDGEKNRLFSDNGLLHSFGLQKPEIVALCEAICEQQKIRVQGVYSIGELIAALTRVMNSPRVPGAYGSSE